jgi:thiol-disulfide isomerase/thioredoxin
LRDTATVVVFFSTTCPFCKRHNQHVDKLARATAGRGLQVIAAAHDRQSEPVRQYLASQGYTFEATLDATPLHAALSERRVIPLTCVIDRLGLLREVIPGEMFEEDVLELARWARV